MTLLAELSIATPAEPWAALGLPIADDTTVVAGVRLRFVGGDGGVSGWGLSDLPSPVDSIDGVTTFEAELPEFGAPDPLGVVSFDHVVVMTSSLDRTCGEIDRLTGSPLKRIREAGAIRQGFHRFGPVVVEVVESDRVQSDTASLWGFVWNVSDLDAVCEHLGADVISAPKPAVQPGRRIATVRASVGLGVPLALMTP